MYTVSDTVYRYHGLPNFFAHSENTSDQSEAFCCILFIFLLSIAFVLISMRAKTGYSIALIWPIDTLPSFMGSGLDQVYIVFETR